MHFLRRFLCRLFGDVRRLRDFTPDTLAELKSWPTGGMIYCTPIGALSGSVLGLVFGIVRILVAKRRAAHETPGD